MRLEILQMVLKSAYNPLLGNKERIYSAMTRDAGNIINASISIVDIITNTLIIVICFVYMGILAWKLLLCLLVLMAFTIVVYAYSEKRSRAMFNKGLEQDDIFVKYIGEILAGFKEIVIERRKGYAIRDKHMLKAVMTSEMLNKRALVSYLNNRVIGQLSFYAFIGALLLYLGHALNIEPGTLINFIFLLLYVFGPIETAVVLIPGLSQAKISLDRLSSLSSDLLETESVELEISRTDGFTKLEIKDLYYQYEARNEDERAFSVGPLDFSVEAGKAIFIFGGNGSGKTTFINLMIGLFPCAAANIHINGRKIENTQSPGYRGLFAPVFSDFYLFDECYSIENIDVKKIDRYLKMFELENKVSFVGDKFTTTDLSTGQRKRLALVCAMLEQKPVLVLDEFGADQDPYFRRKFYTEILDSLKSEGFTVVAITHDDHYYHCADQIYKMDYGLMELVEVYNESKVTV
jgi:cyclic peptide transporter